MYDEGGTWLDRKFQTNSKKGNRSWLGGVWRRCHEDVCMCALFLLRAALVVVCWSFFMHCSSDREYSCRH